MTILTVLVLVFRRTVDENRQLTDVEIRSRRVKSKTAVPRKPVALVLETLAMLSWACAIVSEGQPRQSPPCPAAKGKIFMSAYKRLHRWSYECCSWFQPRTSAIRHLERLHPTKAMDSGRDYKGNHPTLSAVLLGGPLSGPCGIPRSRIMASTHSERSQFPSLAPFRIPYLPAPWPRLTSSSL